MMKAAVLHAASDLRVEDVPVPSIGPEDALVRVRACGICASDVHYFVHGRIGEYVVKEPMIVGHELAGDVVAVGPGVRDLAIGTRVALEPGVTCGRCRMCKSGRYNLCPDVSFFATPPIQGAMSEYAVDPGRFRSSPARPCQLRTRSAVRRPSRWASLLRPDRRQARRFRRDLGRGTHRADSDPRRAPAWRRVLYISATYIPAGWTSLAAWAPWPSTCAPRTSQPSCGNTRRVSEPRHCSTHPALVRSPRRLPSSCARAAPSRWWDCPPRTPHHLPDAHRGP